MHPIKSWKTLAAPLHHCTNPTFLQSERTRFIFHRLFPHFPKNVTQVYVVHFQHHPSEHYCNLKILVYIHLVKLFNHKFFNFCKMCENAQFCGLDSVSLDKTVKNCRRFESHCVLSDLTLNTGE